MRISVILRTYNEERRLDEVLSALEKQTFRDYEIVAVDSGSTDRTRELLTSAGANLTVIAKEDFSYSFASNLACGKAQGEVFCFLSGHSVPVKADYLQRIADAFSDGEVGGMYGDVLPLDDAGFVEKWYYRLGYLKNALRPKRLEKSLHGGILSCCNAAVLRSVWEEHKFSEALGRGGEDVEMAGYILCSGKKILFDRGMLVRHSHALNRKQFREERKKWKELYDGAISYLAKGE